MVENPNAFIGAQKGLGLKLADINLSQDDALFQARLLLYFAELSYAFSLAFSKLAILSFYWRMFKLSNIKIPIQVLVLASIVWLILRVRGHESQYRASDLTIDQDFPRHLPLRSCPGFLG